MRPESFHMDDIRAKLFAPFLIRDPLAALWNVQYVTYKRQALWPRRQRARSLLPPSIDDATETQQQNRDEVQQNNPHMLRCSRCVHGKAEQPRQPHDLFVYMVNRERRNTGMSL